MYASNLISDGSELLLLVPSISGLVGSVILPILGAIPDGCIVLFSGKNKCELILILPLLLIIIIINNNYYYNI